MRNKLLLFDIDGTLLSTHGIPRIAMGNILNRMYENFNYDNGFNFSGRTDWEIIEHLLEFDGRKISPELVKNIMGAFAVELKKQLQNGMPPLIYVGVQELLEALADIPVCTVDELGEADAIIFGTPTRFGNMCGQMRQFLDSTGGLWLSGGLVGKVGVP